MDLLDKLLKKRTVLYFADCAHTYNVLKIGEEFPHIVGSDFTRIYPIVANFDGTRTIEKLSEIKPDYIFKEGIGIVGRENTDNISQELLDFTLTAFNPDVFYVERINTRCKLIYLDKGCRAYEEEKQKGRELHWAEVINNNLKPLETAVAYIGAGHIFRGNNKEIGNLTDYLTKYKIKTDLVHKTLNRDQILFFVEDFRKKYKSS